MSNTFFADEETAYAKDTRAQAQNQVNVSVIQSCFHNNGYVKYALAQSQRTTPNLLVYIYIFLPRVLTRFPSFFPATAHTLKYELYFTVTTREDPKCSGVSVR